MKIITGYQGEAHITSQQDRNTNIGIFGKTARIIKGIGSQMAATAISATEVQIADGMVVCEGCTAEIERGTTESLVIDNGSQGMLRRDLIVVRYTRDAGTGIENMELAVIKGTPASSNPATPAHNTGVIADGDAVVDFPLYRVNISGISITSITQIMEYVSVPNWINMINDKIGTTSMGTSATTITGAIKEIVTKIGSSTMNTTATTLTGAVREIMGIIGTATMSTSATTLKGAVNELLNGINSLKTRATTLEGRVGSATLNTSSRTCTWAINEILGIIGETSMGTSATTVKAAIKELVDKIGSTTLTTSNKTLTGAIKELHNLIGTVSMGTSATTVKGAINEVRAHDAGQGIRCVSFAFGNLQFDSTGAINSVKNFSSVVPDGYTAIAAIPFASGSYAAYFYSCGLETSTTCRVRLFRGEWTSVTQTNPSIVLICKKNL